MESLSRKYVGITGLDHLKAVCDILVSMKYQKLDVPFESKFICILPSGEFGGFMGIPVGYTETTMQDLLSMRNKRVIESAEQRATHPEELPFIDDEPRYHDGYHIRPKPRQRVYAVIGEWQPDWSQAPEWADAWRTTECGQAWWSRGNWFVRGAGWHATGSYPRATEAPSFGFSGEWKQSEIRRSLQHVILEQTVSA